jgi:hypothetical protein
MTEDLEPDASTHIASVADAPHDRIIIALLGHVLVPTGESTVCLAGLEMIDGSFDPEEFDLEIGEQRTASLEGQQPGHCRNEVTLLAASNF